MTKNIEQTSNKSIYRSAIINSIEILGDCLDYCIEQVRDSDVKLLDEHKISELVDKLPNMILSEVELENCANNQLFVMSSVKVLLSYTKYAIE